MSKGKDVVINLGNYRLVRFDSMNLEMEEFRKPNPNKGKNLVKDDSPKWRKTGHYFQSIASGVSWLLERRTLNECDECALGESVRRYREIADELKGYVETAANPK